MCFYSLMAWSRCLIIFNSKYRKLPHQHLEGQERSLGELFLFLQSLFHAHLVPLIRANVHVSSQTTWNRTTTSRSSLRSPQPTQRLPTIRNCPFPRRPLRYVFHNLFILSIHSSNVLTRSPRLPWRSRWTLTPVCNTFII